MGDSRYYTVTQSFNIIFLTLLIVVIVISFMLFVYKGSKDRKFISVIQLILGLSVLCRFIEEIAYSQNSIEFFSLASTYLLGLHVLAFAIFFIIELSRNGIDKKLIATTLLLFCIPLLLWALNSNTEKLVLSLFASNISVIAVRSMPYKMSSKVFNDVKDQILDYVFITNSNGGIIFKSGKVVESDIFRNTDHIDPDDIFSMFNNTVTIRQSFGKLFIKYPGVTDLYFQYTKKPILDNHKVSGFIISFIDITELIRLLDKLKQQKKETEYANTKLSLYKDIVYDIEREKEINLLLDEIAENQQKTLLQLKLDIEELRNNMNCDFIERVSKLIFASKDDLYEIRRAVTAYMNLWSRK